MNKKEAPIGVFDSGVGGISVLRQLVRALPAEDFLYFGDSANAPYGTKTKEEVCRLTTEHVKALMKRGVKAVVIACNTATSAAASSLREKYEDFIIVGIEPAVKPAALSSKHSRVLALATPMTVKEAKFHELVGKYDHEAEIYPLAAPEIVTLVENGKAKRKEMDAYLESLFAPYKEKNINAVVLGCTHFPFAREAIANYWGDEVQIFDGAVGTAKELKRRLMQKGLLREETRQGVVFIENSGGKEKEELARKLLS